MIIEGNYSYNYPDTSLLDKLDDEEAKVPDASGKQRMADIIQKIFDDANAKVGAKVVRTVVAPQLIQFEIRPKRGVGLGKITALEGKITALEGKIKEALAVDSIHIIAPMPCSCNAAIQVPRKDRAVVPFASVLDDEAWMNSKVKVRYSKIPLWIPLWIPLALGKDIYGKNTILDLYHKNNLLIGGTHEDEIKKCMDTIIASMLFKLAPEDLNLIMIDSKGDLNDFAKLPHLSMPLIKDADKALAVLEDMVEEMERRFRLLASNWGNDINARHDSIISYNRLAPKHGEILDDKGKPIPAKLPFIVIVIDDLADFLKIATQEFEYRLAWLAPHCYQAGIHIIAATAWPISKVPMIMKYFPTRIAFRCDTSEESRTLIDMDGAETLLGEGDMLLRVSGCPLSRIQCASVSDSERSRIVDHVAGNVN